MNEKTKQNSVPPQVQQQNLLPLAPLTLIVGHYGVGKTNLSMNLAIDTARSGKQVTLIDLDIVNPYFRSSDYGALLKDEGVELIAPLYAGTTLDMPSLSGRIDTLINAAGENHTVIFDVGGDDVGATALGRFGKKIAAHPHAMLYVLNAYRNLTQDITEAVSLLRDIEAKSGLRATGLVNNSHLQGETALATLLASRDFAENIARDTNLPLLATTIPHPLLHDLDASQTPKASNCPKSSAFFPPEVPLNPYLVQVYVHTPWEL
ncbi:MAG: ParA family protein [Eggerthellaceae bacterium]|nr:ParA family protein [Eggerthellaceae bacterium]